MQVVVKPRKIGGSLVVTIPKEIVQKERIKPGQPLIIQIKKSRADFFGALKELPSFSKKDEFYEK
ncbi:hypothetical protein A3K63_01925 [Candidatus Micrarchaeota archaeon RBG_16_49_10]|nr:MAG: hypothetical protein A3K63_01925 [Candidatus Micrarchaeota archaeon RBG_16_49_10]